VAVAAHLGIALEEYDRKIRAFIPGYEPMLAAAAAALRRLEVPAPAIVDVGIGTGALAEACLRECPDARVTGIDEDAAVLDVARTRLAGQPGAAFVHGSVLDVQLPRCDAIVASFALHHVRTAEQKRALYRACRHALRPGGLLVSADCFTAVSPALQALDRLAWRAHLERSYSTAEAEAFLAAWAKEDVYFPLRDELDMLDEAGLVPDVVWRAGSFAVVAAEKGSG
jgi:ubiquinone/menaquinone biosynthesis C-methylase UbiE